MNYQDFTTIPYCVEKNAGRLRYSMVEKLFGKPCITKKVNFKRLRIEKNG